MPPQRGMPFCLLHSVMSSTSTTLSAVTVALRAFSTQDMPQCIHIVGTTDTRAERAGLAPFLALENKIKRWVMMNHFAQECRSGSVFAERDTMCAI